MRSIRLQAIGVTLALTVSTIGLSYFPAKAANGDDPADVIATRTAPGETTTITDGPNGFKIVTFLDAGGNVVSVIESGTANSNAAETEAEPDPAPETASEPEAEPEAEVEPEPESALQNAPSGEQIGATADDLISVVFQPNPVPSLFDALVPPEKNVADTETRKCKRLKRFLVNIEKRLADATKAVENSPQRGLGRSGRESAASADLRAEKLAEASAFRVRALVFKENCLTKEKQDELETQIREDIADISHDLEVTKREVEKTRKELKTGTSRFGGKLDSSDRTYAKNTLEFYTERAAQQQSSLDTLRGAFGSTTSNFIEETPSTSTNRFKAVINKDRFSGAEINPILMGDGFTGKFYFGDNSGVRPWVVFLNTSGSYSGDNRVGADRATQAWNVALGGQMRINAKTSLGIVGGYKHGIVKQKATDSRLESDILSIGVSATHKLSQNTILALSASYGEGENQLTVGNSVGEFDASVFGASASLSNSMKFNELTLATSLNAAISAIERDSYRDSNAIFVPEASTTQSNFSANASISRTFTDIGNFTTITPSIGISANYNTRENLIANLVNNTNAQELGLGATVNSGLAFKFRGGQSANISASYGLFQNDVQNWRVNASLNFPLN